MTASRSSNSSVICEYLDEKYPHNPLVPSDLVERARMRAWTHYIEEVAVAAIRVPSFNRAFLYRFDGLDQQQFDDQQVKIRKVRKELFQRMGSPQGFSRAGSIVRSSSSARPAGAWTKPSPGKALGSWARSSRWPTCW